MIKRTAVIAFGAIVAFTRQAGAHDVITTNLTYSRDISRILANRCLSCHSPGSAIPLTSYQEVRPWAVDIKEQILSRQMPPWGAVKGFGDLTTDNGLSEQELLMIAGWVVGGAPEGDPATLPSSAQIHEDPHLPALHDRISVNRSKRLDQDIRLAAIRPTPSSIVSSAKITATLATGRKEPLVWLFRYDPKWSQVFRFRKSVLLPAGTVVQSDAPLRFVLQTE